MSKKIKLPSNLVASMEYWINSIFDTLERDEVPEALCPTVMLNALYQFQLQLIQQRIESGKVKPEEAIKNEITIAKDFFNVVEGQLQEMLGSYSLISPNIH